MNFVIHPYYLSWQKRSFDFAIICAAFLVLAPFLIFLLLLLYFTSGAPIFFQQLRMGQHKKTFKIWKFRSMKIGAEKEKARLIKLNQAPWPMFKIYNDPRYTKIGKLLSMTGIDELPQFWNILKGEMSVVGPRPLPVYEARKLGLEWDFRYKVKPGVISEWAVNPQRYQSLKKWRELEKMTLKKGGWIYDLNLIRLTIQYLASDR